MEEDLGKNEVITDGWERSTRRRLVSKEKVQQRSTTHKHHEQRAINSLSPLHLPGRKRREWIKEVLQLKKKKKLVVHKYVSEVNIRALVITWRLTIGFKGVE